MGNTLDNMKINPQVPVLSIRQPWAWLIVNGHKDIENRSWPTKRRGKFYIHASSGMTKIEYEVCRDAAEEQGIEIPSHMALKRNQGGIVGTAVITDSVTDSKSAWYQGKCGFILKDAKPLPFHKCKGRLGFFFIK
jgi:hypothetical protein